MHIDGNHKLIKWRFIIFGGIYGYSHAVVYLKCCDNNRAASMMLQAVMAYHQA